MLYCSSAGKSALNETKGERENSKRGKGKRGEKVRNQSHATTGKKKPPMRTHLDEGFRGGSRQRTSARLRLWLVAGMLLLLLLMLLKVVFHGNSLGKEHLDALLDDFLRVVGSFAKRR